MLIREKDNRWLVIIVIIVSTTVFILNTIPTSFAKPSYGENCLECHETGISVSINATEPVQLAPNSEFWLEVTASGGPSRDMMLTWSNVSHNSLFQFGPSEVEDNDPNDRQSDGGSITAIFKVSAPSLEGNYAIQAYAASAGTKGGFAEVEIVVGAGGVVPKPLTEIVMGLIATAVPEALVGIVVLMIVLYFINWRRIRGETHTW